VTWLVYLLQSERTHVFIEHNHQEDLVEEADPELVRYPRTTNIQRHHTQLIVVFAHPL
jgi:hypothetical protein